MPGRPLYSVVVPVYRNEEFIPELIRTFAAISERARALHGVATEFVFVVDASPDRSYELLARALPSAPFRSQLVRHVRNFGAFAAVRTGLQAGRGDLFAVIAADLQEPPELLLDFLAALLDGKHEVAAGVREGRDDPAGTRAASNLFWALYRRLVMPEIPRGGVDVFACTRRVRDALLALREANSSLVCLVFWLGFSRTYLPYHRRARAHGRSGWTLRKRVTYLLDNVFAFTDLPVRILSALGFVGVLVALVLGALVLAARIEGSLAVPGYAATVITIIFFGGLNTLGLGLVGAYAWRAYENTKQRPLAVIGSEHAFAGSAPDAAGSAAEAAGVGRAGVGGRGMIELSALLAAESDRIGPGTRVSHLARVLAGAQIGAGCEIGDGAQLESDVVLGDRVKVKSGAVLPDGVRLEDDVLVGPNATFVTEKYPIGRSRTAEVQRIVVRQGASIGANATLLPGIEIGAGALIGAGAVVTRSIPANAIVYGNPARIRGYVDTSRVAEPSPLVSAPSEKPSSAAIGVGRARLHELKLVKDARGSLSVADFGPDIPFAPKRYFVVFDVPSRDARGEHAHKTCDQFLICVRGSCSLVLDDGAHRREVRLDRPDLGVYMPAMVWGAQYAYTADATLLVFASELYDPDDYIRTYDEFLARAGR